MKIVILGAAQHAEVVASMAIDCPTVEVVGFLDDDPAKQGKEILGIPVLAPIEALHELFRSGEVDGAFLGLSARQMALRVKLLRELAEAGVPQPNLIHSTAWIAPTAVVGQGNFIGPYVVINHHAKVGNACAFYSQAVVEHHCVIKDNVYMGPGAKTTADVVIGANTYVGVNASFIPHVVVAPNSTVAAGCVVTKSHEESGLIAGVPGEFKKKSELPLAVNPK